MAFLNLRRLGLAKFQVNIVLQKAPVNCIHFNFFIVSNIFLISKFFLSVCLGIFRAIVFFLRLRGGDWLNLTHLASCINQDQNSWYPSFSQFLAWCFHFYTNLIYPICPIYKYMHMFRKHDKRIIFIFYKRMSL